MIKSTAVIFHYFERNSTYKNNLIYFLAVAVHDPADYYIIISGECSVSLPEYPNVTYIKSKNWNNDFGGYIKYINEYFKSSYEYFIFINSSVRGPFLPSYVEENWTDILVGRLKFDVHLVGSSINILPESSPYSGMFFEKYNYSGPYAHVQTTAYALTNEAIQYLIDIDFYDVRDELSKNDVIVSYELRLSQEIIRNGWNISTILPVYGDIDYRNISNIYDNFSARTGDVLYDSAFFGRTLSPYECLFIKINRNMICETELASYTFTGLYKVRHKLNEFEAGSDLLLESFKTAKIPSSESTRKPFIQPRIYVPVLN